jgi:hypothetical protein
LCHIDQLPWLRFHASSGSFFVGAVSGSSGSVAKNIRDGRGGVACLI